jgi:hypothetical protein
VNLVRTEVMVRNRCDRPCRFVNLG